MRAIKFKRYYKNDQTGEVVSRLWGCIDHHSESVDDFSSFASPSYVHGYRPIADCQFAGLLDKNGKEIYEGDVIKFHEGNYPLNYTVVFVEEWTMWVNKGSFCLKWVRDDRDATGTHKPLNELNKCEVIGNIHENPELL